MINMISERKKNRIIKRLREERKKYEGRIAWHINKYIQNIDSALNEWDSRESIEYCTGIKIRKMGNIIF